MNIKYKMKNALGKNVYCVIPADADKDEAFKKIFGFVAGAGYTAEVGEGEICVVDYFRGDTVGVYEILSTEETDEEPTNGFLPM